MILESIMTVLSVVLKLIFSFIKLPAMPKNLSSIIDKYLDLIFSNLDFLNFFIDVEIFKIIASLSVTLFGVKELYLLVMWVWRKLPISSN